MCALVNPRMSEQEYLAFERASEIKHEYFAGELFAMSGASEAHNLISGNVVTNLNIQLRNRQCLVYPSDMRVRVSATGLYTYPDISVACGKPQFADDQFDTLLNPALLVEVLSPSTERYDRGRKFQDYRLLPSLQEYLLIAQDAPRIEHYLRQPDESWRLTDTQGLESSLVLPTLGCTLALAEIYLKVTFES